MVTIEKWYTPCASQGPTQGPPSCAVEEKIEHVLSRIKAISPKVLVYTLLWQSEMMSIIESSLPDR